MRGWARAVVHCWCWCGSADGTDSGRWEREWASKGPSGDYAVVLVMVVVLLLLLLLLADPS
jgi:hypothetical protein